MYKDRVSILYLFNRLITDRQIEFKILLRRVPVVFQEKVGFVKQCIFGGGAIFLFFKDQISILCLLSRLNIDQQIEFDILLKVGMLVLFQLNESFENQCIFGGGAQYFLKIL